MQRRLAINILERFIQNIEDYLRNGGRLPVEEVWLYGSLLDPTEHSPNDIDVYVAYPEEAYWFMNEDGFEQEQKFKSSALNEITDIQLDVNDLDSVHRANLTILRPNQKIVKALVWHSGDAVNEWHERVSRATSKG